MNEPRFLTEQEWLQRWKAGIVPLQGAYLGFYSSVVDGFFREPWGYWVPVDDHIVHRGDGIFEAMRVIERGIFDLDGHLARLARSAEKVSLSLPFSIEQIRQKCLDLAKLCDESEAVIRLYVSRGPGDFTPNPYNPKRSQLYIAMTPWKNMPGRWYEEGVRAGVSLIPGKRPFEATIKSCNYLQNVMQKKDAIDRGLDFTVCLNDRGECLEGSTESFYIVTNDDKMLVPSTEITLAGTTMNVVRRLAESRVGKGLRSVSEARFGRDEIAAAKEMAFVGTTIGVCPVTNWESKPLGNGTVGRFSQELGQMLDRAMRSDPSVRTAF